MTHCISSWKGHTSSSGCHFMLPETQQMLLSNSGDQRINVWKYCVEPDETKYKEIYWWNARNRLKSSKTPHLQENAIVKIKAECFVWSKFASFAFFCALPMLFSICFQMHQSEMFTAPMCSQLELLRVVVEKGITFGWFMEGMEIQPPLQRWFDKLLYRWWCSGFFWIIAHWMRIVRMLVQVCVCVCVFV